MKILYKPGKENHVADALSQIQINILCPIPQKRIHAEIWHNHRTNESIFPRYKTIQDGRESERFKIDQQLLYYRNDETSDWRLCLPNCQIRDKIIHDNHDSKVAGHPGIVKTYSNVAGTYYWPGMAKDIRKHIQELCDACQRTKKSAQPPSGKLQPMPIPATPWASIGMDFLGPVPMSKKGNEIILIVVDDSRKWPISSRQSGSLPARSLLSYSSSMFFNITDYQNPSCRIETRNSQVTFGKRFTRNSA